MTRRWAKSNWKQALADQAQQEQEDDPPRNPAQRGGPGMLAPLVLAQRERQHRPDHEEEEREDQVVEPEPLPVDVLELLGEPLGLRRPPPLHSE